MAAGYPFKNFKSKNNYIVNDNPNADNDEELNIQTQQLKFFFFRQNLSQFEKERSQLIPKRTARDRRSMSGSSLQQGGNTDLDSLSPSSLNRSQSKKERSESPQKAQLAIKRRATQLNDKKPKLLDTKSESGRAKKELSDKRSASGDIANRPEEEAAESYKY